MGSTINNPGGGGALEGTVTGQIHFPDDTDLSFGNILATPDATLTFSTLSANAHLLRLVLPDGDATNAPFFVVSNTTGATFDFSGLAGDIVPSIGIVGETGATFGAIRQDDANDKFQITSIGSDISIEPSDTKNLLISMVSEDQSGYLGVDIQLEQRSTGDGAYDSSGFNSTVTYSGSNSITGGQGGIMAYVNSGSGSVALGQGLAVSVTNNGPSTMAEGVGINISNSVSVGAVTEFTAIKFNDSGAGTAFAFDFIGTNYMTDASNLSVADDGAQRYMNVSSAVNVFEAASGFVRMRGPSGIVLDNGATNMMTFLVDATKTTMYSGTNDYLRIGKTNAVTNHGLNSNDDTFFVGEIEVNGTAYFDGRLLESKGGDVASATDITLGVEGNYFDITGTTQIDTISATGWIAGSMVTLQFDASVTVAHSTAGTGASILLSGSGNFSATVNDTLTIRYDGVTWREIARTVI